jgi:site-specific DNA recombinase
MATTSSTAAVYLRQSLDKNGDLLAVDRQREDVQQLCQRRGWTTREYVDDDFSASVRMPASKRVAKKRPGYTQMVADIKAGKIDAIATWDADRLYRHPRELEDLIDLADDRGLELATTTGDYDLGTPSGRLNTRMLGNVARHEMEQKSMRQKRANKQMAEAEAGGRPWWPSRPFGYDADPDPVNGRWWTGRRDPVTKEILINPIRLHPKEAKLLREAYRQFNAGSSIRSLAAAWNHKGITTPRGNPWTGSAVHALLASARNAGLTPHLRETATVRFDALGRVYIRPRGSTSAREFQHFVDAPLQVA